MNAGLKNLLTEPVDNFVDKTTTPAVTHRNHWLCKFCLNFEQSILIIKINNLRKLVCDTQITTQKKTTNLLT
ncbi:hypothetical protein GCM10008090_31720 [Arenicella chitinivorans]|uniref:Uncharacterized protein n=1 Tax=Arenicella chitinivorans TaxID=1329800 RepID=A0A918VSU7_9GAMM|nr:hypothetical protein GCM10008090_31720 [Arenicella chitinivorans]